MDLSNGKNIHARASGSSQFAGTYRHCAHLQALEKKSWWQAEELTWKSSATLIEQAEQGVD